jgi:hypothetical protein
MGYDILFYTASSTLNNIDITILPFPVIFFKNEGAGTDWKIWLDGLNTIKIDNLKYKWIMFMNDSILLPINGINNCMMSIDKMRKTSDFWGHWLSSESINIHLVGCPIEFKYELIDDIYIFIDSNLKLSKTKSEMINMEVLFTKYLLDKNYKMGSIIKYTDLKNNNLVCPMFNPLLLNQWINNYDTFAIKWKYCISYLNNNVVSREFNYLTRYLYYGPYGTISNW